MTEIHQLPNRTVISDRHFGELLASNKALNDKAAGHNAKVIRFIAGNQATRDRPARMGMSQYQ